LSEKLRRANVNDTVKMSLLCEVDGSCPLCRRDLVVKKKKKNVRVFDVAHIYPLNAISHELTILNNEMPRQARVTVPGSPHYIVQRSHNRQPVFVERRDFEYYLANLQEWKQV
jgi:hypothetical protein